MDGLNSPSSADALRDPKGTFIKQIQQEAAVTNARALIDKLNRHCFTACISTPPSSSLSRKEETCLTQCMEKYMATWNTVSRAYIARAQRGVGNVVAQDSGVSESFLPDDSGTSSGGDSNSGSGGSSKGWGWGS